MRVFYLIGLLITGLNASPTVIQVTGTSIPELSGKLKGDNSVHISLEVITAHHEACARYYKSAGFNYLAPQVVSVLLKTICGSFQNGTCTLNQPLDLELDLVNVNKKAVSVEGRLVPDPDESNNSVVFVTTMKECRSNCVRVF